jgi:hypothetical protein
LSLSIAATTIQIYLYSKKSVARMRSTVLSRAIHPNAIIQVAHLAQGNLVIFVNFLASVISYPGEPCYPIQHFTEHMSAHHHFSELEHKPPGMAHQPSAYLDG